MTPLRLPAGVGQHQRCHLVVFQDADIHLKQLDVILPGFVEVFYSDAYLLYAGDIVFMGHLMSVCMKQ